VNWQWYHCVALLYFTKGWKYAGGMKYEMLLKFHSSITQCWLTFLLSIKFYLWHYFVYWLQNNRLPPPNGLNDVPKAVVLLYPEGTYWLLYKLLSVSIIWFLHSPHILPTFPYSNTFHLAAHKITNCFFIHCRNRQKNIDLMIQVSLLLYPHSPEMSSPVQNERQYGTFCSRSFT